LENSYKNRIYNNLNYNQYLNYFILLYAFCLPISIAGVSFATIMLILLWFLQKDFKNKFEEIKSSYFIIAIVIFILYSLVSASWSSDKIFALEYVKKYYHFLIIPIIFTSLKKEYINKIFSAFLLGMIISEITSYGIFFEIWTKEGVSSSDPSPFMDHSNYSTYLAFTAFILFYKIIYSDELKWKISYGIFFLLSTRNLFLNGGRTGQFFFLITLLLVGFISFKNKIRSTFLLLFLVSSIFLAAYSFSPVFKDRFDYFIHDIEQMVYQKDFSNSFSLRYALWMTGLEASKKDFIIGTGIGNEVENIDIGIEKYSIPDYFISENYIDFHNFFVQYLVQLGLVMILLIFYFLITIRIKNKMYNNLLYIFAILYILHSMTGNSFHISASMILFVLFSSVFIAIGKYDTEKKNNAL